MNKIKTVYLLTHMHKHGRDSAIFVNENDAQDRARQLESMEDWDDETEYLEIEALPLQY